jgi:hypothetical protein
VPIPKPGRLESKTSRFGLRSEATVAGVVWRRNGGEKPGWAKRVVDHGLGGAKHRAQYGMTPLLVAVSSGAARDYCGTGPAPAPNALRRVYKCPL